MPINTYEQTTNPPIGMAHAADPRYNAASSRWLHTVATKTADYTILESDFGKIFVNLGATAAITFTLPAVANLPDGWWVRVFGAVLAHGLTVASNGSSDNIIAVNDVAADSVALSTSNEKAGSGFEFVWDDTNSKWLCFPMTGETVTVTVA